jgi:hypothetical protein
MSTTKVVPTGNWIQTFSGGKFHPLHPSAEEVNIRDIAHALANQCRFAGHVRDFYSIAQHSVLVSWNCPKEFALWGLLHDAAEAYICDLPRPIKYDPEMAIYKVIEKRIEAVIIEHFGLAPTVEPPEIKATDRRLLYTERRDLLPPLPWDSDDWGMGLEGQPFEWRITSWEPKQAERIFMARYEELTNGRN